MKQDRLFARHAVSAMLVITVFMAMVAAAAQGQPPLVLSEQGSFFVNGETIQTNYPNTDPESSGRIVVNQMYVEYWVPHEKKQGAFPVVMVHGSGHTGKTYGETPDGREGWRTNFLRQGYTVYVVDQVGRARSSFDPTPINQAVVESNAGLIPPEGQPRFTYESAWDVFRFGPEPDAWHEGIQFPIEALDQYMAQTVPNTETTLPDSFETGNALAALLDRIGPAVVMGHSQGGRYVLSAAEQRPQLMKAVITVEAACLLPPYESPNQIGLALGPVTMLDIFGDYIEGHSFWPRLKAECAEIVDVVNANGGNARHLSLPDIGITGNDHMMMMDKNSAEIAQVIMDWIDENVEASPTGSPAPTGGGMTGGGGN